MTSSSAISMVAASSLPRAAKPDGTTTILESPMTPLSVTFLGTCSGGGPILSRNCSSLAVNIDGSLWLFDCAEGTQMQLQHSKLKLGKITKIFITHMHVDHCLGLVPLLANIMSGVNNTSESLEALKAQGTAKIPLLHIYGPPPLRLHLRQTLSFTQCTLSSVYAVHEIIPAGAESSASCQEGDLGDNEGVGRDLRCDEDGVWRDVLVGELEKKKGGKKEWRVDVGLIEHRIQSLGFILSEPPIYEKLDVGPYIPLLESNRSALASLDPPILHPRSILSLLSSTRQSYTLPSGDILHPPSESTTKQSRKLTILGDCSGASNLVFREMAKDSSLLVHECTNAWTPDQIQQAEKGKKSRAGEVVGTSVNQIRTREGLQEQIKPNLAGVIRDTDAGSSELTESQLEAKKVVENKARSRGHSTPDIAGGFARDIQARRLAMNHFSAMFPSPRYTSDGPFPSLLSPMSHGATNRNAPPVTVSELHRRIIMSSMETQATAAWSTGVSSKLRAVATRDLMTYEIPSHELTREEVAQMAVSAEEAKKVVDAWCHGGAQEVGDRMDVKLGGLIALNGEAVKTDGKPPKEIPASVLSTAANDLPQAPKAKPKRSRNPRKRRADYASSSGQVASKFADAAEEDDVDDLLDDMNDLGLDDDDDNATAKSTNETTAGKKPRKRQPWRGQGRASKTKGSDRSNNLLS